MTDFKPDFLFGSATASYQVEGAANEGGRTPSIWDTFSHTPGKTTNGDTGDVACDQYHRYAGDVALMKEMGLQAYRFSISWSRVLPDAVGAVNPEGIAYYRALAEELHAHGIKAAATLYHWDLPQTLQDAGGWTNRATAEAFGEYARAMARELGDVVDLWSTLNEPWCSAYLGYASGAHAPGHTDPAESFAAVHHLNLAHGLAVRALRGELGADLPVMLTLNLHVIHPATDTPEDRAAAQKILTVGNEVWLQPAFEGRYPAELAELTAGVTDWSFVHEGDLEVIHQPNVILGVNYYSTSTVRQAQPGEPSLSGGHRETGHSPWPGCDDVSFLPPTGPLTEMGWNQEPDALRALLVEMGRRYPGLVQMVTENGGAFPDPVSPDGQVHDADRIAYLRAHLGAVRDAIAEGADVRAYFLWSLLDNFEWAWGYEKRFGIIRVDYNTLERTPKDSSRWYARLIATRTLD